MFNESLGSLSEREGACDLLVFWEKVPIKMPRHELNSLNDGIIDTNQRSKY